MRILLPLLAFLLSACGPLVTRDVTLLTLHGVTVTYELDTRFPPGKIGEARMLGDVCRIRIHPDWVSSLVIAHELGHCLDGGRSRTFGHAGCAWREYTCPPAEGYAETYARLYWERYGTRLGPLGWPGQAGTSELPPHPDEVTPELISTLKH